jgi:hypothetical protein
VKLVETDADRPEDEAEPPPAVTPPVPEKRRAYASLTFTLAVLVGIVVTIYTVFPARKVEATRVTVAQHRQAEPRWQLVAPSHAELAAWTLALLGPGAPLPSERAGLAVIGARPIEVRHREAAVMRLGLEGAGEVTYLVVPARDAPEGRVSRVDGAERIESWRAGAWTCIAVGPEATAAAWGPPLGVP